MKFDHSIHKRYWISEYSKMKILLPPLNIQKKNIIKKYQDEINEEIRNIWNNEGWRGPKGQL